MSSELTGWALQAKDHWKQHRPKMYAEMEKAGTLDQNAQNAANRASDQYAESVGNDGHCFFCHAVVRPFHDHSVCLDNRARNPEHCRPSGYGEIRISKGAASSR